MKEKILLNFFFLFFCFNSIISIPYVNFERVDFRVFAFGIYCTAIIKHPIIYYYFYSFSLFFSSCIRAVFRSVRHVTKTLGMLCLASLGLASSIPYLLHVSKQIILK